MTRRRILNAASNRWNSAITEYAISTAHALKLIGYDVINLGLEGAPFSRRLLEAGQAVVQLPNFSIGQIFCARQQLVTSKPDLIITHGGPETLLLSLAAAAKTPMIRVRGYGFEGEGALAAITHDLGQLGVSSLVVPSNLVKTQLARVTKLPVTVIPLGLDIGRYAMPEHVITSERSQLLIFGRLDPVKGHAEFMKIFKELLGHWQGPKRPQLKIVGLPANLSLRHLEESAASLGLRWQDDVVAISEKVEDVSLLLGQATAGVVSSLGSEIICRVAQEFLLSGTPVIVSGAGSLDEVLVDPSFGASYRGLGIDEAASLVSRMLQVYADESREDRLKRSKIARQMFSLEAMAENWQKQLQAL